MKIISIIILFLIIAAGCRGQSNTKPVMQSQKMCEFDSSWPQYPGGAAAFTKFIYKNLYKGDSVKISKIKGKMFIDLVIDTTGKIKEKLILKGIDKSTDTEMLRVFSIMPKWIPATRDGKKQEQEFVLPIKFN